MPDRTYRACAYCCQQERQTRPQTEDRYVWNHIHLPCHRLIASRCGLLPFEKRGWISRNCYAAASFPPARETEVRRERCYAPAEGLIGLPIRGELARPRERRFGLLPLTQLR